MFGQFIDVQSLAAYPHEKEWIVLPVTLTAKKVIFNNNHIK